MSVYMIIEIEVQDPKPYGEYVRQVPAIVKRYGGRYLVRGGAATTFFGDWHPQRIIVIEFDSREQLNACFGSPEYRLLAPLREQSTRGKAIVVDGGAP